ncbi:MAG: hypothetical protein AAGI48_15290 [Verrucomicrobiota bacterium]
MKALFVSGLFLAAAATACSGEEEAPDGPLNKSEKKFVGKWSGSRDVYKWEIHRKPDRTFEIAFIEPDPGRLFRTFKNYAVGVWWVDGKDYKFEWTEWWGDEGEFDGLITEPVKTIEADKIVTLTEDEEDPENVEVRVEEFKLPAWKHKPAKPAKAAEPEQEKEKAANKTAVE